MIVIPDNCNPGDTFCIEIHNDAEGGAMVVVAEVLLVSFCLFCCSLILKSLFRTKPSLIRMAVEVRPHLVQLLLVPALVS